MSSHPHQSCGTGRCVGRRRVFIALFAYVAVAVGSMSTRALRAQEVQRSAAARREIRGTVVDSASRQPIAGVEVVVIDTRLGTVSDSLGHYRLIGSLPPAVSIAFRRIGFSPLAKRVDVSTGEAVVNVALGSRPVAIAGFNIKADSAAAFLRSEKATATMTPEDVQQHRGQTIGETIKDLPGVSVIQYGPSIAKPVVRGLHSQRIATINSGVPQEGQQWGGEHAPEIDAFAANEIEVIRGPGTILYGSGALGGVVRVVPRPLPTSGLFNGSIATNAFSNNRQGAGSLMLEGSDLPMPWLGSLGWRAQLSMRRAGDAKTPGYFLPNTGFKEIDYNTVVGLTRSWGSSQLSYSHFGTNLGEYIGAHVGNLDDLNRAMAQPFTSSSFADDIARPDQKVTHDMVAWHTTVDVHKAGQVEISYGFQDNVRKEFDNHGFAVGARPAFELQLYTHTLDVQLHHAPWGPFTGTVGVSGMRQGNLSPGRSFLIPQYRLYTGGIFGLEQLTLSRLTLSLGARADDRWQHAYQYGAPVVVSPEDRRNYVGPSGSLGASYTLNESWSIAGTATQAWRPPNVNERFSQGVHHGTAQYEIGDSSLVPERSFNADLTLRHLGARSRLEVSAYRNQINGYIFLQPRDPISTVRGAYPAYNYAQTNALLLGTEVTGQVDPTSWLSLYANANVVRGTDRPTGNSLFDMPADRFTTSARFTGRNSAHVVNPYFEIGTTLVRRQDHVPPVTVYKLPTAGYNLLSLEVGASAITIGRTRVEPSLAVRNAFDARYRDYLSRYRLFVDEPGRDVVLRLTVPFGAAHD